MGDNILPELGDLIFSVLIGYAGALEFLYVLRHLYHWSCSHVNTIKNDAESLKWLQERMRSELAEAEAKELQAGTMVMKDGILYKDGFRIGSEHLAQNTPEANEKRKKELELELKRQREIEEETRTQLANAEAQLAEQRQQTAEVLAAREEDLEKEEAKLFKTECARKEQWTREEEEVSRITEAKQKEEELKICKEKVKACKESENKELQPQQEEKNRISTEEESHKSAEDVNCSLIQGEEDEEGLMEIDAAESLKLFEAERNQEQKQRESEIEEKVTEGGHTLIEKQQQLKHQNEILARTKEAETLDNIRRLLDAENDRVEETVSHGRSEKLRRCEENARKFLEADKEMEELLESVQNIRRHSATESAPQSPVFEELCIKKSISPLSNISDCDADRFTQTLKTQFGQTSNEPYLLTTRPLIFESVSDDTQSYEPQSSLSAQPSEEYGTSNNATFDNTIEVKYTQLERQEPDGGEDNDSRAPTKYTEDYLRSLDGIKQRPIIREDGSGRRRAFRKRRSSGSSNSSFESRTSREEEIKMFTSLEEEELLPKKEGEDNFTPITYSTEPLLKVKTPRRRHKRSPAKDAKISDENTRSSVDMLEEEADKNPWGEIAPEHYKDTPFWKREKSMSIDEEAIELELSSTKSAEEIYVSPTNSPTALSTHLQNEKPLVELQREQIKEVQERTEQQQTNEPSVAIQPNLQMVQSISPDSPIYRKSASPRLRRSPRIEEMDQYEELWNATNEPNASDEILTPTTPSTPSITLNKSPDIGPWCDQYGLLMEGISDFYDFIASVNPSRSRSTSRQASPSTSQPSKPLPKNVEFDQCQSSKHTTIDIYDDTGSALEMDIMKNVVNFIESSQNEPFELSQIIKKQLQNVADSPNINNEEIEGSPIEMEFLIQTLTTKNQSRHTEHDDVKIKHSNVAFETPNLKSQDIEKAHEHPLNITEPLTDSLCIRTRSRSHSPLPTPNNLERSLETRRSKRIRQNEDLSEKLGIGIDISIASSSTEQGKKSPSPSTRCNKDCLNETMNLLEQSIRIENTRSHSRSRSRSPLPTAENLKTGLEHRRQKKIQQNDALFQQLHISISPIADIVSIPSENKSITAPVISIQCCDEESFEKTVNMSLEECEERIDSLESMTNLVETLRLQRSRSKSPMRRLERERTPEPSKTHAGIIESDQLNEGGNENERRSGTPSRSVSISPTRTSIHSPTLSKEDIDFHIMLNLESSQNRMFFKCSEEMESILADKQRQVDAEALNKLSSASEELELRTVTPVSVYDIEDKYKLMSLPTTPHYDRTISQEQIDIQRIKETMLKAGFKRSTYVGESLDLGSEFALLREENARFERSRSPSPSVIYTQSRNKANKQRLEQDKILAELISVSEQAANEKCMGAKPKSIDMGSRLKEIQQSEYEELRYKNAEFQRSRSQSRSPLNEMEAKEIAKIEEDATKQELQYRVSEMGKANINFHEFSRYLNAGFLDNERRASDSALIQKPEIMIQLQEPEEDFDLEPENYHHFRRFSLNQEEPVEEYPNDDYVYVSQIEVQSPSGTRTWIREDYYSENFEELSIFQGSANVAFNIDALNEIAERQIPIAEDEETDGSEDERQTIVEVDDEIDEDICDFNERGPADESHHEQSECEEAEREVDHYANRDADDWQKMENIDEYLANVEGAIGGDVRALEYDSDSAAIDEIYDEAIKNRKQSGIQRDYDNILNEIQRHYLINGGNDSEADMSGMSDNDRTTDGESQKEKSLMPKLIRNGRHENKLRYLGDAAFTERQSARLRTRYGYMPQIYRNCMEGLDFEVDLNYTPKKEYNWRKNFKLDEDDVSANEAQILAKTKEKDMNEATMDQCLKFRKFSLGGESITIFSQGSEGICYMANENQEIVGTKQEGKESSKHDGQLEHVEGMDAEIILEKLKKKKSKKKQHRESRNNSIECYTKDEYDSESQTYSRSNIKTETGSTKSTKSRSRRNSRNNLTTDEVNVDIFLPSNSVLFEETNVSNLTSTNKKKLKKRKKTKEIFSGIESKTEEELPRVKSDHSAYFDLSVKVETASAAITPDTNSNNPLASLSPQNSICTPSSSIDSETSVLKELISGPSSAIASPIQREVSIPSVDMTISPPTITSSSSAVPTVTTRTSTTPATSTTVDTFEILKDANFYPLF